MAISALDSTSTARQLKTTEIGGEHIPHHRDSYVEELLGPKIEGSIVDDPADEASINQLLRGLWRQYRGLVTNRYFNLSLSGGSPLLVYKSGIALVSDYLFMISYSNLTANTAYLMVWNDDPSAVNSIPTGLVPQYMFPMWGETGPVAIGADILSPGGRNFPLGIVWAISSTPTTYTPVTTGNIFVEFYVL